MNRLYKFKYKNRTEQIYLLENEKKKIFKKTDDNLTTDSLNDEFLD